MNDLKLTPWMRLAAAARRARSVAPSDHGDEAAPVGFATRVVARAQLRPAGGLFAGRAFERLAARALALSCAGALTVVVWTALPSRVEASAVSEATSVDYYLDPVGVVMEVVQS
ncbi:MAG: hypothetical protein MUE42_01790 [Opitutaceae bacterium]|jgi:hypothetical protein|nr:hypothetical protein [Opitutaceae bacterium]